jgi:beta-lactamase class A
MLKLWQFNAQQNRLDIQTDESVQPIAQLVVNPTRVVIDLPGIRLGHSKITKPIGGVVQSVRVGQFDAQTTRLVIELAPGYSLDPEQVIVKGASTTRWFVQLPSPQREILPPPGDRLVAKRDPIALKIVPPPAPPPETFGRSISPGQPLNWLQQRLATYRTGYPAFKTSMFFLDVDNGNYADLNGDQAFPAASIIKLPILMAFFQDVDAGKVRLDETLVMRPELIASGSGEMQFLPPWSKFSALHTATQMIIISDNTATNLIIKRLGGAAVLNQRFRSWGLQKTMIRNWLPDLKGTNTITAKEMVQLLAKLETGHLLSDTSKAQALDILRRTKNKKLLPAGLGPGAVIAHKTGDIGFMLGDAGMIQMPNGKRYMAAVLARTPYDDPGGWDFVREISRIVYTYMSDTTTASVTSSP